MSYMTKNTSTALSLKSVTENAEFALDLANTADKAMSFFGASQKTRKDVKVILAIVACVAVIVYIAKALSK